MTNKFILSSYRLSEFPLEVFAKYRNIQLQFLCFIYFAGLTTLS